MNGKNSLNNLFFYFLDLFNLSVNILLNALQFDPRANSFIMLARKFSGWNANVSSTVFSQATCLAGEGMTGYSGDSGINKGNDILAYLF